MERKKNSRIIDNKHIEAIPADDKAENARVGGPREKLSSELAQRLNAPDVRERAMRVAEQIRAGMEEYNAWLKSEENLPGIALPEDQLTRAHHLAEMMGIDPRPLTLRELFAKFKAWVDIKKLEAEFQERAKQRRRLGEVDGGAAASAPPRHREHTEWTKPALPSHWAGIFECDVRTLKALITSGKIGGEFLTTKSWRIALDSLPAKEKDKHRSAK